MESSRKLGASGGARRLAFPVILYLLLGCRSLCCGCEPPSFSRLFEEKRWPEIVAQAAPLARREAEVDYYLGVALAQLGRWEDAGAVLLAGHRAAPDDERFLIELGGVAFKQKRYAEAARWMRRVMRRNPGDAYSADFLGTTYFLQGNVEAALKYWNSAGKPQIESVHVPPELRIDPVLLDRAFTFAPGGALLYSDFLRSRALVASLGVFPIHSFRLDAREDGRFDAALAAVERNGWGNNRREALLSLFRGVFYQTVFPEYFNAGRSAINLTSMVRWDPDKRRLQSTLSAPFRGDPRHRYSLSLDLRDENWDLGQSADPFKLRRSAATGEISLLRGGGWTFSMGGELSHRDYRAGSALPSAVSLEGYQLKHTASLGRELWRFPERRFSSRAGVSSETGRVWSAPSYSFEKLQLSASARWFPRMSGDDYAVLQRVSAGKIFGRVPFDELFILGLERDNGLWMRAHIGTRRGRKGSAPMGRDYFVSNWEIDKNLYDDLLGVKLSPFLDIGKSTDASLGLGAGKWLWDTGVQAKVRIFGVGFAVIYGKDLRSGGNAFYVMATSR